jgi:hypothetical protein
MRPQVAHESPAPQKTRENRVETPGKRFAARLNVTYG